MIYQKFFVFLRTQDCLFSDSTYRAETFCDGYILITEYQYVTDPQNLVKPHTDSLDWISLVCSAYIYTNSIIH